MTLIPEYIIVMTWALAAVIIVAIIAAIFFRLYIMFLSNEKENLRDRIQDYDYQIGSARNRLEKLKEEIRELEARKMEITINLPDWIKLPDWQQRFVLEYKELLERVVKLERMLNNWDNLNFTPKCSKELLTTQYNIMEAYLSILEERATIEGVEFIKLIKQETLK